MQQTKNTTRGKFGKEKEEVSEETLAKRAEYIFPENHKYLTFLKKVFRHELRKSGFRRISTPVFMAKSDLEKVFAKNLDENVYIANVGNVWELALKPNWEISALMSYIDGGLSEEIQPVYSYYMDSFYPVKWEKLNSIGLIWWNVIWEDDAIIDAQNIFIINSILEKIWLNDLFEIKINSVWIKKEQAKFFEALEDFYGDKKHLLTKESLENLENSCLDILNPKSEDEEILVKNAPKFIKFLKKDSKKYYTQFKEYLDILNISYTEDEHLISDYDYANNQVWEFVLKDTGERIANWYRYNTLSTKLWTPKEIPASWFSVSIFRLIELLKQNNISIRNKDELDLYFVQLWDEAKKVVLPLSLQAREAWINTAVSLWTPSMKEQMIKANRSGAKYVVMVAVMEARSWVFQVRDIEAWTQEEVKKDELIEYIISKIGSDKLNFYEPSKDLLEK